jgi:glucan 1,3-beta-glucosidase
MQAIAGIALAALVFLSALFARQRLQGKAETPRWSWLGVAARAAVAGSTLGLTLEKIPLESLGAGGWLRSIALGTIAVGAPPLAAAALAGSVPTPSLARLLGGSGESPPGRLAAALGAALILVCALAIFSALGLVFDPRYKDFPYAPLTAPVIGFVILAIVAHADGQSARLAERVAAVVLAFGAIYISANEGFANWQAQWTAALMLALALTLLRLAGVRRRG